MAGTHPIRDILRIDNVETQPALRITSNDEDRQRQGFEIQTVFSWPSRDGALDVHSAVAESDGHPALFLDYASGTTISRVNKGLRRRREGALFGFHINTSTGRWTKGDEEPEDGEEDPEAPTSQRSSCTSPPEPSEISTRAASACESRNDPGRWISMDQPSRAWVKATVAPLR